MTYVLANTSNPLGRRALGSYPPYPVYGLSRAVARLNGVFNPTGPDPGANTHGAITYRIDPRTGQYIFSRTDIKPRGVFAQNTFQHPPMPLMSALGVPMNNLPIGKSGSWGDPRGRGRGRHVARGRVAVTHGVPVRRGPVSLSYLSCGRGCMGCPLSGACGRRGLSGMGVDPSADVTIDPNTGGQVDSDGVLLTLPCGPGGQQLPISQCPKDSSNIPGASDPGLVQQLIASGRAASTPSGLVIQIAPQNVSMQPQAQTPWYNQSTSIGGMSVSNGALAMGGVLIAALVSEKGSRRR